MIGVRKCLHHPVIRNGDGFMAPVMGPSHNILYLRNSVHVAHLGVTVEFHPLLRRRVLPGLGKIRDLTDTGHRSDGQLPVEFIDGGHAFQLDKSSGTDLRQNIRQLIVADEHLHHNGIGKIRHRKHDDGLLIADLPGLKLDDLAPQGDLSHLRYHLDQFNGLVLKEPSVDLVWIIAFAPGCSGFPLSVLTASVSISPAPLCRFGSRFGRLFFPCLFLPGRLCLLQDGFHLLTQLFLIVLQPALRLPLIEHPDFHRTAKPLPVDFFQICAQRLLLPLCHDRILQLQAENIPVRKGNVRILQHVPLHHADPVQLLQEAFIVFTHNIFRSILGGKRKLLLHPDLDPGTAKELLFQQLFQFVDAGFPNQMSTADLHPDVISPFVGRHLAHIHAVKQKFQLFIHF